MSHLLVFSISTPNPPSSGTPRTATTAAVLVLRASDRDDCIQRSAIAYGPIYKRVMIAAPALPATAPAPARLRPCCGLRACFSATGCSCCERATIDAPQTFDYAWEDSVRSRAILGAVRLVYGIALLGFSIWSWATLSDPNSFGDGFGSAFRTLAQITNC